MCGIAGILHVDRERPVEPHRLQAMSDALAHRGPDGDGCWREGNVGLATRRLAIVDPANGALPMANSSGSRVLAYSGEVFNFEELRRDLEARGHAFRTGSDAEVVLAAYEQYGWSCLERFNGQFAFAIWDGERKGLFLGRDPFGICPLYYSWNGRSFCFASEIKALLALPDLEGRANLAGIADQLVNGCLLSGATAFESVHALEPGCFMWVHEGKILNRRYWTMPMRGVLDERTGPRARETLVRELVEDAVRSRLSREIGWGVLLSGGLDSSTIAVMAAAADGPSFTAYTIDYDNPWQLRHSDSHYAAIVADSAGCAHDILTSTAEDYFASLAEVVRIVEQPFNKAAATSWLLYRHLAGREKVVLCGDGADELFGGYVNSRGMAFSDAAMSSSAAFPWATHRNLAIEVLDPDFLSATEALERGLAARQETLDAGSTLEPLNQYLFQYVKHFLPEILSLQDKTSYSVGIETRYPFLDLRLAEALFAVPAQLKFRDGHEKALIRSAVADLLPRAILDRTKSHLPIPRDPAALRIQRAMAADLLLAPDARTIGYFRRPAIEQLLSEAAQFERADPVRHWQLTMYLITLELHHRCFGL